MFRLLHFRLSRRRAVGEVIGGVIILTLVLTALGMMVFVSQQYDQYQQTVNRIGRYQDQAQSENLVANSPGLNASLNWSGCNKQCNMYNMSLSNLGGVGIQIARVYINSTGTAGSGCSYSPSSKNPQPCVLNPSSSSTSYTFQQSAQFINAGEVDHAVLLYLPASITLPAAAADENTIFIVTSRGNVFSFQWPFQIQMGGQSQFAFSAGIVKVAYQTTSSSGYDSKNEPGPVADGSGGTVTTGYCHKETESSPSYPPGASNAEEMTGVNYANVEDSDVLWFVNPWVTQPILLTATPTSEGGPTGGNTTTLYLAVNITNVGVAAYTVAGGSLDLTWYGSNHLDGALIGIYYEPPTATGPQFYSISATTPQQVAPGKSFQAIYRVSTLELDTGGGGDWPPTVDGAATSVMFWGSAALTNNSEGTFVGGVSLSSGLWIPPSC